MVPDAAPILADPGWNPRWKSWWFASLARTRAGVTTASSARWPTWAITSRMKRWGTSCGATTSHRHRNGVSPRGGIGWPQIQVLGFYLAGFLCLVLAVLKP